MKIGSTTDYAMGVLPTKRGELQMAAGVIYARVAAPTREKAKCWLGTPRGALGEQVVSAWEDTKP
ncbi:hypothetical protein BN2476_270021 [Paraburkholderia piptadeniae]|uniref:Uncharacterized protein n=1 Tax=Paraburkholderia piptadeniae TaxID=1701573 RepID=A0A1N7S1H2_9BURK|nr:hypothetical protein BN2476_270021 [Paraburkholderia piptadeniae]